MTRQHNYMQSPIDSSRRFCCICGEPEPVEENFGRTDVCEHGGMRRKCPICERDEEIRLLREEIDHAKTARDMYRRAALIWFNEAGTKGDELARLRSMEADAIEIKTTGRITYANWNTSTIGITIYKQDGQEDDRMPRVFLTVPDSDMAAFMATRRVVVSIMPIGGFCIGILIYYLYISV